MSLFLCPVVVPPLVKSERWSLPHWAFCLR
nr:MAG TPA: hypothetical protein [Caudoviricetes sp.]